MQWYGFCLAYIIPLSILAGVGLGGWAYFLTPLIAFVIIPLLDLCIGEDRRNPSEEESQALLRQKRFRYILYAYVPLQLLFVTGGAWLSARGGLTPLELTGLVLSMGLMTGGLGITAAHELCHRGRALDKWLARVLLLTVSYMHFYIEHRRGHHARVATPADPASARAGETLYAFWPRTLAGSWRSAWDLEADRLSRLALPLWSRHNQMLWFIALPLLFAAALTLACGWPALPFFALQSLIAILLLETINYLEHYGLERRETSPGQYEPVRPAHAWNSSFKVTNYFLFKLQRHSDHHAHPARPYQILRHCDESPQLPTGYAGMLLLALVPPLWRRVMDPRVAAARYCAELDNNVRLGTLR